MKISSFIMFSTTFFWLVSPDGIILFLQYVGTRPTSFFPQLLFAGVIWFCTLSLLVSTRSQCQQTLYGFLEETIDRFAASTITLAVTLSLVLFLPTGMLVSAGFRFNESILYWFPNFGFSFLLLALLLTLHLFGQYYAKKAQLFFMLVTLSCLLFLVLSGIALQNDTVTPLTSSTSPNVTSFYTTLPVLPLIFLLGFENIPAQKGERSILFVLIQIVIGLTLLSSLGFISLHYVTSEKLAISTIPHVLLGREILGQPGRVLVSVMIISGTCGLVNGLFLLADRSCKQVFNNIINTKSISQYWQDRIFPIVFSVTNGVLLATGLAGSEKLELYIFGSVILWLILIGLYAFAVVKSNKGKTLPAILGFVMGGVYWFTALYLIASHDKPNPLILFIFSVLLISAVLAMLIVLNDKLRQSTITT